MRKVDLILLPQRCGGSLLCPRPRSFPSGHAPQARAGRGRGRRRSTTGRPTVFSIGHRNPQGLDWQPGSHRLVITDHGPSGFDGPSCYDEVDVVVEGGDYGWPT